MASRLIASGLAASLGSGLIVACGGGSSRSSTSSASSAASPATTAAQSSGAAALSAEAGAAATGDIPDTQVFLTFRDPAAGYSISYPEGWAQRGSADDVTFQDKNNIIHAVAASGAAPSAAAVVAELDRQRRRDSSLTHGSTSTLTINGAPVVKVSYSTMSRPNPVTGKQVQLLVNRYVYAHRGKVLTIDLGTPKGVDNVDAYRMISRSVRWQ